MRICVLKGRWTTAMKLQSFLLARYPIKSNPADCPRLALQQFPEDVLAACRGAEL